MAPKSQTVIFRVRGIPEITSREQLERAITEDFQDDEAIKTQLSITPGCASDDSQTSLLEFTPRHPQYLDNVVNDPSGEMTSMILIDDEACLDISIDRNFYGLTQLYPTTPGERIVAE
ncbi:hypothetical protein BDD12DRAFT_803410 [Trichophaea hybrida]|nr:hypothetical protein BDD12DRAFT_803410 [Trichophaea hybrida]